MPCLQVLGVLLLIAGALAILGSSQRNKNLLTASLLLSLLGTLLAFEFVVEVSHPDVTCAAMAQTASVSEPHPLVPIFCLPSACQFVCQSLCLTQTLRCSESVPHSNFAMLGVCASLELCNAHPKVPPCYVRLTRPGDVPILDLQPTKVNCSQLISRL